MQSEKKEWLVKSGGTVIGPFTEPEVVTKLKSREIVSIDECALPMKRWRYMREEPTFAKVMEEIRREDLVKKGDSTITDIQESPLDLTKTEVVIDGIQDDLTDEISTFIKDDRTEEIFYSPEKERERVVKEAPIPKEKLTSYTFEMDSNVAKDAKASARLMWGVTLLVLFAVGAFTLHRQMSRSKGGHVSAASNLLRVARSSLEVGDYSTALDHFKSAYSIEQNLGPDLISMGVLLVQSGESIRGRNILEAAPSETDLDVARIKTGIGVAKLVDKKYVAAKEDFLAAQSSLRSFYPPKANLIFLEYSMGNYQGATDQAEELIKQGYGRPEIVMLAAEAYIHLWLKSKNALFLRRGKRLLGVNFKRNMKFYQESRLLLGYIDYLLNDFEQVKRYIAEFLAVDPRFTEGVRANLYVAWDTVSWQRLGNWCLQMSEGLKVSPRFSALEGFCHHKLDNRERALGLTRDAAVRAPDDVLVRSAYAYVLEETGHGDRAIVELQEVMRQGRVNQPAAYALLAENCFDHHKFDCARKNWKILLEMDSQNLAAIAGLADVYLREKNYGKAKELIERGLVLGGDYRDILRVARELRESGISTQ